MTAQSRNNPISKIILTQALSLADFIKVCLLLSFLIAPALVAGQENTARLKGTVTDRLGAIVAGAVVTAKRRQDGSGVNEIMRTAASDSDGRFEIGQLLPGRYEVSSELLGMVYYNDNVNIRLGHAVELPLVLSYEANCPQRDGKEKLALSDEDKAEIVNQMLVDALANNKIPDFDLLTRQKGPVIISAKDISAKWIKPVSGFEFRVLSQGAIQAKADSGKDFLYLSFDDWQIGSDCVVVTLSNGWAVGKNSEYGYLSGGGWTYKFQKISGKWVGKMVGGWVS